MPTAELLDFVEGKTANLEATSESQIDVDIPVAIDASESEVEKEGE